MNILRTCLLGSAAALVLGSALAQHPKEFPPIDVGVVGAGEHSGQLGLVLERLAVML